MILFFKFHVSNFQFLSEKACANWLLFCRKNRRNQVAVCQCLLLVINPVKMIRLAFAKCREKFCSKEL